MTMDGQTALHLARELEALRIRIDRLEAQEGPTRQDPIQAQIQSLRWLSCQPGPRWIGYNLNQNYLGSSPVESMDLNNLVDENQRLDTVRHYPYTNMVQASTHYLDNYYATWGFWGIDSGVLAGWGQNPGLTAGGWVRISSHTANPQGIVSAWNVYSSDTNYGGAWRVQVDPTGGPGVADGVRVSVSSTGTFESGQEEGSSVAIGTGKWVWAGVRWIPSTSITCYLFQDGVLDTQVNTTTIVSDLYDARYGYLGAYKNSSGTIYSLNGDLGITFFHTQAFSDAQIDRWLALSRHIYGV